MARGTVVTFYSYNGGVGRTLTLANVAAVLAGWGYRVLCVDWDIEAPALSHYFGPWIGSPSLGLMDLIDELAAGLAPDMLGATMTVAAPGMEDRLALIPAGRQDPTYVDRIQSLCWFCLYNEVEDLGARLEEMRADWVRRFDFVLVDSRTGITDMGGTCTVQLPDILVIMFTPNHRSLEGAIDVAHRATKARSGLPYDRARLLVLPAASRFDLREEYDRAVSWQRTFAEWLRQFYADWAVKETTAEQLIERTTIPYFARWTFGAELPVVTETGRGPDFISYYFENLAAVLAHRLARSDLLVESRDSYVDAAHRAGLRRGRFEHDVFVSYSGASEQAALELANRLKSSGVNIFLQERDLAPGENWATESDRSLAQSQHLVAVVVEELSRQQRREIERFIKQTVNEGSERTVFPVLVAGASPRTLPSLLQRAHYFEAGKQSMGSIATNIANVVRSGGFSGDP